MITRQDIKEKNASFLNYMEQIDATLRKKGISIQARPLQAFSMMAQDGIPMIFAGANQDQCGDIVHDWFKDRYGKKLNVNFTIGRSIVLIRDDPYVMKIPLILGQWDGPVYVEDIFDGFTKSYFAALHEQERNQIVSTFANHKESFEYIQKLPSDVKAVLNASTSYIIDSPPYYGQAKWHAHLAVELSLKSYIKSKGGKIPTGSKGHDIKELSEQATLQGFSVIPSAMLNIIKCSAAERYMKDKNYNDIEVTLSQAVKAQHGAIQLCGEIARIINLPDYLRLIAHSQETRRVKSFFVAADHQGTILIIKILMEDNTLEIFHIQTSQAKWLLNNIQNTLDRGYFTDKRKTHIEEKELIDQLEKNFPKLTDEDWDNQHGNRTVTGLNCQMFEGKGAIIIDLHSGDQKVYIFPEQTLIYLKEWLAQYISEPIFQEYLSNAHL